MTLIFLVLFVMMIAVETNKSGLLLKVHEDVTSAVVVDGVLLNISFELYLKRGGTGFIGVEDPTIMFKVTEEDHVDKVPDRIKIDVPEEESCSASSHNKEAYEFVTNFTVFIRFKSPGQCRIIPVGDPNIIEVSEATVDIKIIRSKNLEIINVIIGWIYFFLWSLSFYPQILMNFKRSSVDGLNTDFVILNVIGFTLYSCYNLGMFFDKEIQEEYFNEHPDGVLPVQPNDVVFSVHAMVAASITLVQCLVMRRGGQFISSLCRIYLVIMAIIISVSVILTLIGSITWLTCLNLLSYIKLFITLIKYIPQVIMNYHHKSTKGWSVGNILLDMSGGLASLLQSILIAYNGDDWTSITGDMTKLGLSGVSLAFDAVFLFQHYILYRNKEPYMQIG